MQQFSWADSASGLPGSTGQHEPTMSHPTFVQVAPPIRPVYMLDAPQQTWQRPATCVTAARRTSRRDGVVGITVGLVLLSATLAGSLAMNRVGQHPAGSPTSATMVATPAPMMQPVTTIDPATTEVAGSPSGGKLPFESKSVQAKPRVESKVPRAGTSVTDSRGAVDARGGGAIAATPSHRPARTSGGRPRPAASRPSSVSAGSAAVQPAVKPVAAATSPTASQASAPAPVAAPAPVVTQPVSYSVTTPNGASWTSPASELPQIQVIPSAVLTPNY